MPDTPDPRHLESEPLPTSSTSSNLTWKKLPSFLVADALFATGAALSFIAVYSFLVQAATRYASPTSGMPLMLPMIGMLVFGYGLVDLLFRGTSGPVWTQRRIRCLAGGVLSTIAGACWPQLWR